MDIRRDDPRGPQVADLMALHLAGSRAETPAENAHALGAEALADPAIVFWTAWDGATLLGFAALRTLGSDHGEVKSMRTHPDHLRRGVAAAWLRHIVGHAHGAGLTRLDLETGTAASFAPANRLYEAFGFVDGPVFGGYPASPHNRFMTLAL